jgi:SAM-dependent methyltransferase
LYSDETAQIYDSLGIRDTTYEIGFEAVGQLLGDLTGKLYLDFGSGAGRSTAFLRSLGARRVIGVDRDRSMIRIAREKSLPGADFLEIGPTLPLRDKSVDGATSLNVFIELGQYALIETVCREIGRVVRPGGTFVVMSTNPAAFGRKFRSFSYAPAGTFQSGQLVTCTITANGRSFDIDDTYWSEQDYRRALGASGFEISRIAFPGPSNPGDWTTDEAEVAPFIILKAIRVQSRDSF